MLIHISKVIKLFSLSTENCLIMFPQHTPPKPFLCLSILLFWLRLNVIKIYYVWYTQIWKLDLWKWSIKEKMWNIKLYWNEFFIQATFRFLLSFSFFRSDVEHKWRVGVHLNNNFFKNVKAYKRLSRMRICDARILD